MLIQLVQSIVKWLYGHSELQVLLVGENSSGKTTFLSQLIHGQAVHAIPTIGHYLEPIRRKKRTFSIWDTGRRPTMQTHFQIHKECLS
jgi:GTPase SAR1 family protein